MTERRITKVKLIEKSQRIQIEYDQKNQSAWDQYMITCKDPARPEFYETLKELVKHVIEMCELPDNYTPRIEVRGVSISYSNGMGATISAAMKLIYSSQPLNLNTPYKEWGSENDGQAMSYECHQVLKILQEECNLYIQGERAQGSLFPVNDQPESTLEQAAILQ